MGEVALEHLRHPARELDDLETTRHLAERVARDLAVFRRDDRRQSLRSLIQELAEAEQDLRAFGERRPLPRGERRARRVDRGVDIFGRRKLDESGHATRRWIEHLTSSIGRSLDALSVEP